jgi:molybdopterin-biosynthesis enzyme MoeA-like protein
MKFGLIIVGDEILSGKREDKHFGKVLSLLTARGLSLDFMHMVGDDPHRLEALLRMSFATNDVVFSCGGIGATPDDHTRQCAAKALGLPLVLHPQAQQLIWERMRDMAHTNGHDFDPEHPDNVHRLHMAEFPQGADIIPNPYNKIAGFSIQQHYFVPGFPVMAWPMIEWVLDTHYAHLFHQRVWREHSVIVMGAMEATLTPLMVNIEARHPGIKVFSLPSVDHPQYGRHIELGVKGDEALVGPAFADLQKGLNAFELKLGPLIQR